MQEIKEHIYFLENVHGKNIRARRAFNKVLKGGEKKSNMNSEIAHFFKNKKSIGKKKAKKCI